MKKISLLLLFGICILISCAKINHVKGLDKIVTKHSKIAILPSNAYSFICDELANDDCFKYLQEESEAIYLSLAIAISNKNVSKKYRVEIVPPSITTKMLDEAGIEYKESEDYDGLCKILDVDALVVSEFFVNKPSSVGNSIATATLSTLLLPGIGSGSPTNEIFADVFIYDRHEGKEIWSYTHDNAGGFMSTKSAVQKTLLKNIARKLPFFM